MNYSLVLNSQIWANYVCTLILLCPQTQYLKCGVEFPPSSLHLDRVCVCCNDLAAGWLTPSPLPLVPPPLRMRKPKIERNRELRPNPKKNMVYGTLCRSWLVYTSPPLQCRLQHIYHALRKNFDLCIPRKEVALPQSQYPHSWVCERSIYSLDRSTYFPEAE